jgi:hypothetical protein
LTLGDATVCYAVDARLDEPPPGKPGASLPLSRPSR